MINTAITDRLANIDGKFGVDYINLNTGQEFCFGNCQIFSGSGAIMLMTLIECFRACESGELDRDSRFRLTHKNYEDTDNPSYGVLKYLHEGIELTVSDLYNLIATVSDNVAFNILTDILGIEKINSTFRSLGYTEMKLNRKINDYESMSRGIQNFVSIREIASIFHRMYLGRLISENVSESLLSLLKQHQRTSMIPYVFKETVPVAHMTGFDEDIIIDGGIVLTENPFVLVMAAQDTDIRKAQTIMRDITQICYLNTK